MKKLRLGDKIMIDGEIYTISPGRDNNELFCMSGHLGIPIYFSPTLGSWYILTLAGPVPIKLAKV